MVARTVSVVTAVLRNTAAEIPEHRPNVRKMSTKMQATWEVARTEE